MADTGEKKRSLVEPNLALWDRIARAVVAAAIAVAWLKGYIPADVAYIALLLGGALLVNGLFGRCALYSLIGFSTCKIPKRKTEK